MIPRNLRNLLERHAKIKNENVRIFLAEMLGVIIYITIGLSSIAQYRLSIVGNPYMSDPLSLYVGYSVGLTFAVLIVGKISGLSLLLFWKFNLIPIYLTFNLKKRSQHKHGRYICKTSRGRHWNREIFSLLCGPIARLFYRSRLGVYHLLRAN
jgi:hypothetical protein